MSSVRDTSIAVGVANDCVQEVCESHYALGALPHATTTIMISTTTSYSAASTTTIEPVRTTKLGEYISVSVSGKNEM